MSGECHKVSYWLMQKEAIFVRFLLKNKDIFSWTTHLFLVAHSHDWKSRSLKCAAVLAEKETNSDFKVGAFCSIKHIIFCKELQKSWYLIYIILEMPHLYFFSLFYIYWCEKSMWIPQNTCGCQKTTCRAPFSPLSVELIRIELGLLILAASTFILCPKPPS